MYKSSLTRLRNVCFRLDPQASKITLLTVYLFYSREAHIHLHCLQGEGEGTGVRPVEVRPSFLQVLVLVAHTSAVETTDKGPLRLVLSPHGAHLPADPHQVSTATRNRRTTPPTTRLTRAGVLRLMT